MPPFAPAVSPDDVLPHTFDGCDPQTKLETNMLTGEVPVRVDRIILVHNVLRLFRTAAFVSQDDTIANRYPSNRIWGFDIRKIAAYLARTMGDDFTTSFSSLSWSNTFNRLRVIAEKCSGGEMLDVAPRVRTTLASMLDAHTIISRNEAWHNFQILCRALAPIFSGEVTREDLLA